MKRYLAGNQRSYMFIAVQAILYVIFLALDITGSHSIVSSGVKFGIIILCFCYALAFGRSDNKSIAFSMKMALLFTLISDLFLLLLDYYICGLITFIIVQQLYSYRIILAAHKRPALFLKRLMVQAIISTAIGILLGLLGVTLEVLLVLSIFYFVSIATNMVSAVRTALLWTEERSNVLYAVGMILFLMCDINVGIFNMSGFVVLPDSVYHLLYSLSSILMWTFYAPSQVIITLSIVWTWQNTQIHD